MSEEDAEGDRRGRRRREGGREREGGNVGKEHVEKRMGGGIPREIDCEVYPEPEQDIGERDEAQRVYHAIPFK